MVAAEDDLELPEEEVLDLEDCWKEARRSSKKQAASAPVKAPSPGAIYREPQNWSETRRVALVHKGTQAYLGTYTELVHKFVPGCRRLVRCTHLVTVSEIEEVSGDSWLDEPRREIEL